MERDAEKQLGRQILTKANRQKLKNIDTMNLNQETQDKQRKPV